jgi:hypothetical protein
MLSSGKTSIRSLFADAMMGSIITCRVLQEKFIG